MGSGKSVVAHFLRTLKIPVYDSDSKSKLLVNSNKYIHNKLIQIVGTNVYNNNILNKEILASYIFENSEHLKKINNIIHPVVEQDFLNWTTLQNADILGIESAILIDAGFDKFVNKIVCVTAPLETRINRTMQRDNKERILIEKRIKNQINDDERLRKSDFIIINDGKKLIIPQILYIISSLLNKDSLL